MKNGIYYCEANMIDEDEYGIWIIPRGQAEATLLPHDNIHKVFCFYKQ